MFEKSKKIAYRSGPSWPDFHKLTLHDKVLFVISQKTKWFPFNILVHKILKSDLGDLHDHYWSYVTIILKGGYWETTENGTFWRVQAI